MYAIVGVDVHSVKCMDVDEECCREWAFGMFFLVGSMISSLQCFSLVFEVTIYPDCEKYIIQLL